MTYAHLFDFLDRWEIAPETAVDYGETPPTYAAISTTRSILTQWEGEGPSIDDVPWELVPDGHGGIYFEFNRDGKRFRSIRVGTDGYERMAKTGS